MNFLKKIFGAKPVPATQPEDLYNVEINGDYVKMTHPHRPDELIRWDEIEEIKLANTDEGPFLPDVWLLLLGNGKGCSIPQGSKGWDAVYDIVSKYPGFNFENVVRSAACTDNQLFDIWKKAAP